MQPRFFNPTVDFVEQVDLDCDEDDLNLFVQATANNLVIPDDLVDREGDILLRLERNDLVDLSLLNCGQFHKTRKDRLPGQRIVYRAVFDVQLVHHLAQSDGHLRPAHFLSGGVAWDLAQSTVQQN